MSTGNQIDDQEGLYYLTFTIVDWIDVFTRQVYRDIIIDSLNYCNKEKGLDIFAFIVMSNHIHLIVQSRTGSLSNTIRDFKKFTSKEIIETIKTVPESRRVWMLDRFAINGNHGKGNEKYHVWKHDNHAVYLYTPEFIREKIDYLHNNPVRAGIVEKPEDYLYSSARYYAELDCLVNICDIGLPWVTVR